MNNGDKFTKVHYASEIPPPKKKKLTKSKRKQDKL